MAVKNKFDLSDIVKDIKKKLDIDIPDYLATYTKMVFTENFKKQGFDDGTNIERWKPRKDQLRNNRKSKSPLGKSTLTRWTHPILVKSGALRDSIKIKEKNSKRIVIISNLPYSKIHNDGLMGLAWGKYPFQMPKRQYMGHSEGLTRLQRKMIIHIIDKCFTK